MKKSFLYLFLIVSLLSCPLSAQQWKAAVQRAEKLARQNIQNYNTRLEQSAKRAAAVHRAYKKTAKHPTFIKEYPLRKNQPLMEVARGWMLAENREWVAQRIIYERALRRILQHKDQFDSALETLPQLTPAQLARLIPTHKKYIFMGEYHDDDISSQLQQTIVEYARIHPEKEIIIFSEFAPETQKSIPWWNPVLKAYFSRYNKAGLRWVGLEEEYPLQIEILAYEKEPIFPQGMLTGMKARNTHWIATLKSYRQKYPNAVFFIHSGSAHTDYQEPYTVSAAFKRDESFVMQFIPANDRYVNMKQFEKFHSITQGKYLHEGVLKWKNKDLAHMAGFDVQVLLNTEN